MSTASQAEQPLPQPRTVRLKDAIRLAKAKYGYFDGRGNRGTGSSEQKRKNQAKYWQKKYYNDSEFRAKKRAAEKERIARIRADPELRKQLNLRHKEQRRAKMERMKVEDPERYRAHLDQEAKSQRERYARKKVEDPEWHAALLERKRQERRKRIGDKPVKEPVQRAPKEERRRKSAREWYARKKAEDPGWYEARRERDRQRDRDRRARKKGQEVIP